MSVPPFRDLLPLAALVLDLGMVQRATRHQDGVTPETDTTHSVMLALVAVSLIPYMPQPLDPATVLRMALIHDLDEVQGGDVNTILGLSDEAKQAKQVIEDASMARIATDLDGTPGGWIITMMELYRQQEIPEARYVHVVDKLVPTLTHWLNDGEAVRLMGITEDEVADAIQMQRADLESKHPDFALLGEYFTENVARRHE